MTNIIKNARIKAKQYIQWLMSVIMCLISIPYNHTLRIRIINKELLEKLKTNGDNIIFAFWHGAGYLPVWCMRGRGICVYTSIFRNKTHRPLEFTQFKRRMWLRAFKFLGYNIVDASLYGNTETTGVIKFLEEIKHGSDGIIAVDGPKGPMCKAKKGAIYLAKKTGAVIVPVAAEAAKKTVRTNQWDKLFIPKLFSKGVLVFGSPIRVPQDADDNAISRFTLRLQENLNSLTCQAQALARA